MTQAGFAAALLAPDLPCPAGLRAWNGSDPSARLAVYRNNVVSSLIDAVADTFPVVQVLVGEAFFRAMAGVFVRQHPPRSRVLAHYGAEFADFVDGFAPARGVPYLADVARLERARVLAYHAADAEPLTAEMLGEALSCGQDLGALQLVCHPSTSVVVSEHAIVSLWAAHQGEGDLSGVDPALPESALVVRPGLDVLVVRLPPGAARFVVALKSGAGLADASERAAGEAAEFDLPNVLALLMRHGALASVQFPGSLPR
ncbi:MAG: DNA-binding domain-containing protein [Burkholderiaceae bacterium]